MAEKHKRLIERTLGNRNTAVSTLTEVESTSLYKAYLPLPDFQGLPFVWLFLIVDETCSLDSEEIIHIATEARQRHRNFPLAILANGVNRVDRYLNAYSSCELFPIDVDELPDGRQRLPASSSPLILALRGQGRHDDVVGKRLPTPYRRGEPASGWRFFGREDKLDQLLDESSSSFVIFGPRRVGKTSLMREAERRLKERGDRVFFVDLQYQSSYGDVANRISGELSARLTTTALRRNKGLGGRLLDEVIQSLRKMSSASGRLPVLFLDELGTAIQYARQRDKSDPTDRDQWSLLGRLRAAIHGGELRIIASCFNEWQINDLDDHNTPLVNFAPQMRLEVFNQSDVESFLTAPLQLWFPLTADDKAEFVSFVINEVGTHPFLLQYFCFNLFKKVKSAEDIMPAAQTIVGRELHLFTEPVESIFYNITPPLLRYLFLKQGMEAELRDKMRDLLLDDAWVKKELKELGLSTTVADRRNILFQMELFGFLEPADHYRREFRNCVPVVYKLVQRGEPDIRTYLDELAADILHNLDDWNLKMES